ncbi:MAG: nitrophenyl compound nitroreductase subunit ArsF family protein [Bacteroidales bacterium]
MKRIAAVLLIFFALAANAMAQTKSDFVEVIYFHRTNRCNTCQSIEKVTSDLLKKDYKKEMQSGSVVFHSIDYQLDTSNIQVKKYNVEGPTLLVVTHSKKKENIFDLTEIAFENALSSPALLRKEIAERIDVFFR